MMNHESSFNSQHLVNRSKILDALFDLSSIGIACCDVLTMKFVDVNPWLCKATGYTHDELCNMNLLELTHPEDLPTCQALFRRMLIETTYRVGIEKRYLKKDGSILWVSVAADSIFLNEDRGHFIIATIQDITARKESELEITKREELFRSLANTIPHLACIAEADGRTFWYNEGWMKFLGKTQAEISSQDVRNCHQPETLERVRKVWNNSLRYSVPFKMEYQLKDKAGIFRWFLTRMNPIKDTDGKVIRWIGTSTDIDEQKNFTENLRIANCEAEKAKQATSQFVAFVTHELRSPLSALLGFAEILESIKKLDPVADRYLKIMIRNGQQLAQIINDLLDLSKTEARKLCFKYLLTSPTLLVQESLEQLSLIAKQKGTKFRFNVSADIPPQIATDPLRFKQILINILGNALKFTNEGMIQVRLFMVADKERRIAVEVEDNGVGISEIGASRIFKLFSQAEASTFEKFGGTGIGLSLSRQLAEDLGGSLTLMRSEVCRGACFRLELPDLPDRILKEPLDSVSHACEIESVVPSLKGRHILVIDDSEEMRELLKLFLERDGAVVVTANHGGDGVKEASENTYDLILMDLHMPVMDGHTALEKIRMHNSGIPVVAISANTFSEAENVHRTEKFDAYLSKPINSISLIRTAQYLTRLSRASNIQNPC